MKSYLLFTIVCIGLGFSALAQNEGNPTAPGEGAQTPPAADRQLPAALDEERSKQISNYFDEALRNYEDILESRPEAESKSTEDRVAALQKLMDEQEQGLDVSEGTLRAIKLAYLRQYLSLKNSFEQGTIDEKTYYQKVDALGKKYAYEIQSLKEDVNYYRDQSGKTGTKLQEQQEIDRINKIFLAEARKQKPGAGKSPEAALPQRTPTELELLIPRIEAAGCFQHRNVGKKLPDFK